MKEKEDPWFNYKKRLLKHVGFKRMGYDMLTDHLIDAAFEWYINSDYNRAADGLFLRENLIGEHSSIDGPCTVLEMLCALATRMETEYIGDDCDIFEELLDNLDLLSFDNENYDEIEVGDILDTWMGRKFNFDGCGSIFPLIHPSRDQRDIEIWGQMQEYINENW